MKKGWTTTKLVAVGSLSALDVLIHWLLYGSPLVASGSTLAGIVALIITPFFITLTILIANQFPAATLFLFINFILDLPSPKLFPAPLNLVLVFVDGLLIDSIYSWLKSRTILTSFASGAAYNVVYGLAAIVLFYTVGIFGSNRVPKLLTQPVGILTAELIMILVGGLVGVLAANIYTKISLTSVIKRIQQ